jgi:hypothetical protein
VVITAPPDPMGIEKRLAIRVRGDRWTIAHRLRNTGDMLWSGGAWALTCTRPSARTRYRIALDGGPPAWDVLTMVIPRRWGGGHTSRVDDPQFVLGEDALVIRPRGTEAKRMLQTWKGELEMIEPALGTLRKSAPYLAGGRYPLSCNVAVYLGPSRFMVELETMSPTATLVPGESLTHTETWRLAR